MSEKTHSKLVYILIIAAIILTAFWWFYRDSGPKNMEQARSELTTIASGAQDYYLKPRMIGGGGRSFEGLTFEDIRLQGAERQPDGNRLITNTAEYRIVEISEEELTVEAVLLQDRNSVLVAVIGSDFLSIEEM